MKYDEFAFFNQQLAAMLRDGIPLEGALKRLCEEMRGGSLRTELQALDSDLAQGKPLVEALQPRALPELYKRMLLVGVKSNDLPGALTMLADYFQRQSNIVARLKGLMVYPLIVLFMAFFISCFLAYILGTFIWVNLQSITNSQIPVLSNTVWMTPGLVGLLLAAALTAAFASPVRRLLRWRLPAFREASIAQLSSAICLMLKNGIPLDDALRLAEELEKGTRAELEIREWRQRLAAGHGKFAQLATASPNNGRSVFPSLFVWIIAQSGEDMVTGLQRAADLFESRAHYRTEMMLYSALPCAVLALAAMIVSQVTPVFAVLISFIQSLSGS